jgi:hypothetical protein
VTIWLHIASLISRSQNFCGGKSFGVILRCLSQFAFGEMTERVAFADRTNLQQSKNNFFVCRYFAAEFRGIPPEFGGNQGFPSDSASGCHWLLALLTCQPQHHKVVRYKFRRNLAECSRFR